MSAFGIFVIVLTVIYVVYYGVMLAYDQYGVKGQKKNDVEEFESPEETHEVSRRVHENTDGTFTVTEEVPGQEEEDSSAGDDLFDAPPSDDDGGYHDEDIDITTGDAEDSSAGNANSGGDKDDDSAYNRLKQIQDDLPTIVPSYEEEYDSLGMLVVMNEPMEAETRVHREVLRY